MDFDNIGVLTWVFTGVYSLDMSKKVRKRPDVDTTISRTVKALLAANDDNGYQLSDALYLSRATYFARLNGSTEWRASEVRIIADYFGVPVELLYNGIGSVVPTDPTQRGGRRPSVTTAAIGSFTGENDSRCPVTRHYLPRKSYTPSIRRPGMRRVMAANVHPHFGDRHTSPKGETCPTRSVPTGGTSKRAICARRPSPRTCRG